MARFLMGLCLVAHVPLVFPKAGFKPALQLHVPGTVDGSEEQCFVPYSALDIHTLQVTGTSEVLSGVLFIQKTRKVKHLISTHSAGHKRQ